MEDEVFEKHYLKLWEQYFLIFTINQKLYGRQSNDYKKKEAKEKIKRILEEIENNAFSKGMDDVMKNIEMFTPKEAKP